MNADNATEMESARGSVLLLPLAVLGRYVQLTSGKPGQVTMDLFLTLLANTLRIDLRVRPLEEDPSVAIAYRDFGVCPPGMSQLGNRLDSI